MAVGIVPLEEGREIFYGKSRREFQSQQWLFLFRTHVILLKDSETKHNKANLFAIYFATSESYLIKNNIFFDNYRHKHQTKFVTLRF